MGFISWYRTIYLIFGCLVLYMFYKLVWGKLHDPLRHLLILSRHNLISSYQAFWSASLTMLIEIIFEWNELWSLVIKSKGKWERERSTNSFILIICLLSQIFLFFIFNFCGETETGNPERLSILVSKLSKSGSPWQVFGEQWDYNWTDLHSG